MTTRTYEQDIADVLAVQAGDSEAWLRIRRGYAQNVIKVARQYEGVIDEAEAVDVAWSAIAEHVLTVSADDAKFIRNAIGHVAREALDAEMFPEIPKRSLTRLRGAYVAMDEQVDPNGEPQMTLQQAASSAGVSLEALENYRMLAQMLSFDALIDDSIDEDNPFGQDAAGGYCADDVDVAHDPELMSLPSVSSVTNLVEHSVSTKSTKVQVREAVADLPPRQQQVIALFMQGLEDEDIAAELEISRITVRRHRQDAIQTLRSSISI
jgi:DNA-binding CsgD family transcriptional regulator